MVGAGIAGLATGLFLARRGIPVVVMAGPRKPVGAPVDLLGRRDDLQLLTARARAVLAAEAPEVLAYLTGAGETGTTGLVGPSPTEDPLPTLVGYRGQEGDSALRLFGVRRSTLESALRAAAVAQPGFELRCGSAATGLLTNPLPAGLCTVRGLTTDAGLVHAGVVVDAGGGQSTFANRHHGCHHPHRVGTGGATATWSRDAPTGFWYLARSYRLGTHASPRGVTAVSAALDRYGVELLSTAGDVFSLAFTAPADDRELLDALSAPPRFDAAAAMVEPLAPWVDPDVATPVGGVKVLCSARNRFGPATGALGLHAVGHAACRTDPAHGRDLTLTLLGAQHLARVLQSYSDPHTRAEAAEAFATTELAPWVDASVARDHARLQRWQPDVLPPEPRWWPSTSDADARLAARRDPLAWRLVARMDNGLARPDEVLERSDLAAAVSRVRESGWRPPGPRAPDREELLAAALGVPAFPDKTRATSAAAVQRSLSTPAAPASGSPSTWR